MNEKVKALGRECLRVLGTAQKTGSFLGGRPLVREHIDWPVKNGKPLGFIAQLDLTEINRDKTISWLPDSGRILFFYDLEQWPWGFDPKDRGGWAVIYENGKQPLFNLPLPINLHPEHLAPNIKYVTSEPFISYPDAQRLNFSSVGLSEDDDDEYYDFIESNFGEEPHHQIGGYPNPIQNDSMEDECQLVSGGVYCGNSDGYYSAKAEELRRSSNDWELLFQFDSDDEIDVMWGDSGMLYFWVKESEAKELDFSNSWMILQCC